MPDPQHGTATASNGVITYTSDPGWIGTDSIGYVASDGHGGTVTETFSVDVVAPAAPVCETPDPVDVRTGARRTVDAPVLRRLRRPELDFEITDPPELGTLDPPGDGTSQLRTYTRGRRAGQRHVLLPRDERQRDGEHRHPGPPPHRRPPTSRRPAPATRASPRPCPAGRRRRSTPGCEDDDGDALGYTKLSEPAHGTLSDAGGTLVYTPAVGYSGPDQFDFKATDGHGGQSAHGHAPRQRRGPAPPTCAPSDADHAAARTRRARWSSTATTARAAGSPT